MSLVEIRVNGRYKLGQKICAASFGDIYYGKNVQSNQDVAIKMELSKKRYQQIIYESKVLNSLQGGIGIPTVYWSGQEGDYNVIVLDCLGKNLDYLFNLCDRKFTLKTVLMIAEQILSNIEYIHFKNYVHRNVKPDNFLIGIGKKSHKIYTIDFALAKLYRDGKNFEHVPYNENKKMVTTPRYASINAHKGIEKTRRDDLESLGYMLIYFLKGNLPWKDLNCETREENISKIKEMKNIINIEELCTDLPLEFVTYMNYCRNLKFDEKPDYGYLKKIFKELFVKSGYEYDYVYDWLLIPYEKENEDFLFFNKGSNENIDNGNMIDLINEDEEKTIQQLIELCKKRIERKPRSFSIDSYKNDEFLNEEIKSNSDFNISGLQNQQSLQKKNDNSFHNTIYNQKQVNEKYTEGNMIHKKNTSNASEKINIPEKKNSFGQAPIATVPIDKKGKINKKNVGDKKDCNIF